MRYAIIGFGRIGHAIAGAFARSGVELSVATTRDPESFASDAAAIGPTIVPRTLAEAVKADVLIMTESAKALGLSPPMPNAHRKRWGHWVSQSRSS